MMIFVCFRECVDYNIADGETSGQVSLQEGAIPAVVLGGHRQPHPLQMYALPHAVLKERYMNHIYFLISDQGILLKATSSNYLRTTEEEINKFFTAKIEQLEVTASSDFYEKILEDIRE
jgi:hypothetical protein